MLIEKTSHSTRLHDVSNQLRQDAVWLREGQLHRHRYRSCLRVAADPVKQSRALVLLVSRWYRVSEPAAGATRAFVAILSNGLLWTNIWHRPIIYDEYIAHLNRVQTTCEPTTKSAIVLTCVRQNGYTILTNERLHFFYMRFLSPTESDKGTDLGEAITWTNICKIFNSIYAPIWRICWR